MTSPFLPRLPHVLVASGPVGDGERIGVLGTSRLSIAGSGQ